MAAAVADARPSRPADEKITKSELASITLEKNPDILAGLANKTWKPSLRWICCRDGEVIRDKGLKKLHAKALITLCYRC